MLQRVKDGAMLSTDHHGEHMVVRGSASPLAADVQENWCVSFINDELIVEPVSLLVGALVWLIEVVDLVIEVVCRVLVH